MTESNLTVFGNHYKIDKCIIYGDKYLERKTTCTEIKFWKELIESMYNLRLVTRPILDFGYLSWPLWHYGIPQIPKIPSLESKNILMVADLLDPFWEIMSKEEIERNTNVTLNFLEHMAIKKGITKFIKNAERLSLNMGPHRPEMLNLVFTQKKDVNKSIEELERSATRLINVKNDRKRHRI